MTVFQSRTFFARHMPPQPSSLVLDLISLPHLNEPSVLVALRTNYLSHEAIYTANGPTLLAVNPFMNLPKTYTNEVLRKYQVREEASNALYALF